jgi:hypothetical protein
MFEILTILELVVLCNLELVVSAVGACYFVFCTSLDGRRPATLVYVLGLKTSVLPTSIWHRQMCQ